MALKASVLTRAIWGVARFTGGGSSGELWNGREESIVGSTSGVQGLGLD
jgi:hypothetical protein